MKHELKIWPVYYERVANGSKTFEVRRNDRNFQMGDEVILREWDPDPINPTDMTSSPKGFTSSKPLNFNVGYVHVLDEKTVVFSLLPIKKLKVVK